MFLIYHTLEPLSILSIVRKLLRLRLNQGKNYNICKKAKKVLTIAYVVIYNRCMGKQGVTDKTKPIIGFGICKKCGQQFPIYEGSRRKYCEPCEVIVERTSGGRPRKNGKAKEV